MAASEETLLRWTRIILLIAIILTVPFLITFVVLSLHINQDQGCGYDKAGPFTTASVSPKTFILNSPTDQYFQEFNLNTTNYIDYTACFTINTTGNGTKVEIIDGNNTILATEYALPGLKGYCLPASFPADKAYIGLQCPTCNASTTVIIQEVLAGDKRTLIEQTNATTIVKQDTEIALTIFAEKSCKITLRFFLWTYIWIMAGLFFMILILIGFNRFEKFLFEDFPKL